MAKRKEHVEKAEEELGKVLLSLPFRQDPRESCPSARMLRRLVAGSLASDFERNRILDHIGVCPICFDTVPRLCHRRNLARRLAVAVAACFFLGSILWIWISKSTAHSFPVATMDLREIAATRSSQPDSHPATRVGADTRQIVIILPQSREAGMYEVEVKTAIDSRLSLLHTTASTTLKDSRLELIVDLDFSRVARGKYLLAVRHASSGWEYVPLQRE